MELGAFSISLAVKDLNASRTFYEALGFKVVGGDHKGYLMLRNPAGVLIGVFQGMFDKNILTFNPGLAQSTEQVADFTDVRDIRAALLNAGLTLTTDLDPAAEGPAHIVLTDPDGNPVLIDQFFPRPGSGAPAEPVCDAPAAD